MVVAPKIQVIRQKNEASRERILDFDQAKETGFVLGGQSVKENHLVTDDSTVFGKRAVFEDLVIGTVFERVTKKTP